MLIGNSSTIRRPADYFDYKKTTEDIEFMSICACKKIYDEIFMYLNHKSAELFSSEGERYLLRLSDVSSFGEAKQKELIIRICSTIYKIFHYLYSLGKLEVANFGTHVEIYLDTKRISDEEGVLCFLFVFMDNLRCN